MPGTKNISAPKTPFKSINTGDQDLSRVQDAIVASLAEVDQRFAQYMNALVPVGAILDWHKNLPGMPALPPNFIECNGQKIVDDRSPLNGSTVEDLNGQGYFTRGGAKSGVVQAADTVVPAHAHSLASHTHDLNSHTHGLNSHTHGASGLTFTGSPHQHEISTSATTGGTFAAVAANNRIDDNLGGFTRAQTAGGTIGGNTAGPSTANTTGPSVANTLGPSVANTGTDGGSGSETRPKNVSYVKVMRIW